MVKSKYYELIYIYDLRSADNNSNDELALPPVGGVAYTYSLVPIEEQLLDILKFVNILK